MKSQYARLGPYLLAAACSGAPEEIVAPPVELPARAIVFNGFSSSYAWDIWMIDPGGSGLRNLTNSPERDLYPAWSSDTRRIAYFSDVPQEGIYTMNVDGSDKQFVAAADDVGHITWSPDGTRLAFHGRVADALSIFVVPSTGGTPQRLSTSPTGWSPSWSPDGASITYASGPGYGSEIYVIDATGKNRRNITLSWGELIGEVDPVWSPDGSQIAFARVNEKGESMGVWIMNADGSNPRQITTGITDRVPAWSRDGTQLVIQLEHPTTPLCIADIAGRRLASCLTTGTRVAGHPSW